MADEDERNVEDVSVVAPTELVVADDTEYLDLDQDGVPDAVRTTRVTGYDVTGDGEVDVVETVQEVASAIDETGAPHHVVITDTVAVDLDHDGTDDYVDAVEVEVDVVDDGAEVRAEG